MGSFANSEDPDEIQQNAAFYQGLHCLLRLKPIFRVRNTYFLYEYVWEKTSEYKVLLFILA